MRAQAQQLMALKRALQQARVQTAPMTSPTTRVWPLLRPPAPLCKPPALSLPREWQSVLPSIATLLPAMLTPAVHMTVH